MHNIIYILRVILKSYFIKIHVFLAASFNQVSHQNSVCIALAKLPRVLPPSHTIVPITLIIFVEDDSGGQCGIRRRSAIV